MLLYLIPQKGLPLKIAQLYRHYFTKLANQLHSTYGSGPPDPEDVAQQAFEKLNQHKNPADLSNPEGFLWICARNIIISEKRAEQVRDKGQQWLEQDYFAYNGQHLNPERSLLADAHLRIIKDELLKMPERRRQIFLYNRVHGMTPEKAGHRCGVSRTAAVKHIAAASAQITLAINESQRPANEVEL